MLRQAGSLYTHPGALACPARGVTAVTSLSSRFSASSRRLGASRTQQICYARNSKQAAAAEAPPEPEGDLLLVQVAPSEDGQPGVYLPYDPNRSEIQPRFIDSEELLDGLDGVDVQQQPEAAVAAQDVQVGVI